MVKEYELIIHKKYYVDDVVARVMRIKDGTNFIEYPDFDEIYFKIMNALNEIVFKSIHKPYMTTFVATESTVCVSDEVYGIGLIPINTLHFKLDDSHIMKVRDLCHEIAEDYNQGPSLKCIDDGTVFLKGWYFGTGGVPDRL